MSASLLFMGKRDDPYCEKAVELVRGNCADAEIHLARHGDPWPQEADDWQGDIIVSYLSPFIIPEGLLKVAKKAAINFHPGPPQYPGIGCTNFALYNEETEYGVTCHHMATKVDTGPIIAVGRFLIIPEDTVSTLGERCYIHILELFTEIMGIIFEGRPLPQSDEMWTREPYKRSQLNALCQVTPEMSASEVARRIRSVTFPGAPGAFINIHGHRFEYDAPSPNPIETPKP